MIGPKETFPVNNTTATVIAIVGICTLADKQELMERCNEVFESGSRAFFLDLKDLKHFDSSFVGVLVAQHIRFTGDNGRFGIINPSPKFYDALQISKLIEVLKVYSAVDEALYALALPNP